MSVIYPFNVFYINPFKIELNVNAISENIKLICKVLYHQNSLVYGTFGRHSVFTEIYNLLKFAIV